MLSDSIVTYITKNRISIFIQFILTFLTYLLVKYRYKTPAQNLIFSKRTKEKLIKSFLPDPLVRPVSLPRPFYSVKANFANYDVFNFSSMFKEQIKATIREYGVGTCGPRGFYGTLDIHLNLETKLAKIFAKDEAILYSNYFTCVQSIISCFCKTRNNVFVHKNASECIKSGLRICQAKVHEFENFDELVTLLKKPEIKDKYLVTERIGKNTGELINLETLVKLKEMYGFRIILDEAYSIPFLYQEPADKSLYSKIDLVMGALCLGYPANGGFCVSCKEAIEYQRLSGAAYVFSASLPAFLSKAVLCMLEERIEYKKLQEKIQIARKHIKDVVSYEKTPILLVKCEDIERSYDQLKSEGYIVGRCGEYLRLCINEESKEEDLKRIGMLLK